VKTVSRAFRILIVLTISAPGACTPNAGATDLFTRGMVVSADSIASAIGVEILKEGGTAVDAAVAVGFALAVTFPEAGNIGGGGFMVIRLSNGRTAMVDFREKAPLKATPTMYQDPAGNLIPRKSLLGPLAAGVPGTVAGLLTAHDEFGVLTRQQVLNPAISLARDGFVVDSRLEQSLRSHLDLFSRFPASLKIYTDHGRPYHEGDIFRQPELAATLEAIRDSGRSGFYGGWVADSIVAVMQHEGGIISLNDLSGYQAVVRTPLLGSYRGYEILTAAPPSAGGTVLLEMLNILERFDLHGRGFHSPSALNLFCSAAQIAYADRSRYIGDPDVVQVPTQQLISKEYAAGRSALIDTLHATPSTGISAGSFTPGPGHETTQYCVGDKFGNVASTTFTLNSLYGCKAAVGGAGFVLNNEMDDFTTRVGHADQFRLVGGRANEIRPGKRMVSSMTPTIVLKDHMPVLVVGARGGGRITTAVAQVIMNIIDFAQPATEAVRNPRVHYQWMTDTLDYEPAGISAESLKDLETMGYIPRSTPSATGRVEALWFDQNTGSYLGAPDFREPGVAIGY
jgi:gamma-glutamyltranspeptidase / glutathione hydrolase